MYFSSVGENIYLFSRQDLTVFMTLVAYLKLSAQNIFHLQVKYVLNACDLRATHERFFSFLESLVILNLLVSVLALQI